jgi:hypothetical protein
MSSQAAVAAKLRRELERRPQASEVDALRRSVASLQSVIHVAESGEVLAAAATCETEDMASQAALPAALIGARRRALEAEQRCIELSAKLADAQSGADALRLRAESSEQRCSTLAALVQRLEADLELCSGATGGGTDGVTTGAGGDRQDDGQMLELLPVVTRQRDRLKQRVGQLEDELAAASRDVAQARAATALANQELQHLQRVLSTNGAAGAGDTRTEGKPAQDTSFGARIRRRAVAMACLGGDRKGSSRSPAAFDAESGGALSAGGGGARALGGAWGGMPTVGVVAYVALLHLVLLRQAFAS